jgi:hypothetical protein
MMNMIRAETTNPIPLKEIMENNKNIATSMKLFLLSGALTGTVWMWSLFANKSVQDLNKQKQANASKNNQPPQVFVPVAIEQMATATLVSTDADSTAIPSPTLRVVNIAGGTVPTAAPLVVMYSAPSTSNTSTSSSGSSGSTSSNPVPVTSTSSSTP